MDYVRIPTQFLYCLKYAAGKEYCTFVIILILNAVLVGYLKTVLEEIFIINEVYLNASRLE